MNNKVKGYPKVAHLFGIDCEDHFKKISTKIQGVWNVVEMKDSYVLSRKKDPKVCFEVNSSVDIVYLLESYMGHAWMIDHKLMEIRK
jgi:hypothetical protein